MKQALEKTITQLDFFIQIVVGVVLKNLKNMSFVLNQVTIPLKVKPSQTLMQKQIF